LFEMLVASARLGLTATPPARGGALERHVGPVVYALAVADLVGDGLAEYDVVTVAIDLDRNERVAYRAARGAFSKVFGAFRRVSPAGSWREFIAAARRTSEGREALAAWRAS